MEKTPEQATLTEQAALALAKKHADEVKKRRYEMARLFNAGVLHRLGIKNVTEKEIQGMAEDKLEGLEALFKMRHMSRKAHFCTGMLISSYANSLAAVQAIEPEDVKDLVADLSTPAFKDELIMNMSPFINTALGGVIGHLSFTTSKYIVRRHKNSIQDFLAPYKDDLMRACSEGSGERPDDRQHGEGGPGGA